MPVSETLAKRIWDIFAEPTPPQRKTYLQNIKDHKIPVEPGKTPVKKFSPFKPDHIERAEDIFQQFSNIAKGQPDEEAAITKVLDAYSDLKGKENPDLLYYSLELFLTHYEGSAQFLIPSLLIREPELTVPSASAGPQAHLAIAVGSPEETKIDWFREDPLLNEHHGHWHIVYARNIRKDRQGEMFIYMHQQMLARYDADRLSEGVKRVAPFNDMLKQPVKVGYAAGDDVRLSQAIGGPRNPNIFVRPSDAQQQLTQLSNVKKDIDSGLYDLPPGNNTFSAETDKVNRLGSNIESNIQAEPKPYNNYHGNGHVYIGQLNDGVMFDTQSAIRDVAFWEWHKGVDDLGYSLQQRYPAYNFSADAPPVLLRKSVDGQGKPFTADIILCRIQDVPGSNIAAFNGQQTGLSAFGNNNWNTAFAKGTFNYKDEKSVQQTIKTTDTLTTFMKQGAIRYNSGGQARQYNYKYLSHEEFCYFIRIENTSLEQKQVTVRIFLAPEEAAEDRRMWIEMDKFLQELPPKSKTVVYRKDTQASVIRKPAVKDPTTFNTNFNPVNIPIDDRQCTCGWPYHMLLPKGSAKDAGMPFRLMVMITDAAIDLIAKEPDCGSLSYCGAKNNLYPDKRPLGYPFNRKFNGNGNAILNAITTNNNMACRTIFIKHQL